MRLTYDSTGEEVKIGDKVCLGAQNDRRVDNLARRAFLSLLEAEGYEVLFVTAIQRPRHPASTGRVYVAPSMKKAAEAQGYFPSVIGATWIEREDR
ncbi:MAG: hypothetical protein FJ399_08595 [Verrucomicrobia bacterium]|nr:hypothetical protein [Verrucomicrobiota bacterium]